MSIEYTTMREEYHQRLEAEFNSELLSGNVDRAYEIFGMLMKYKYLDKADARLGKKYAMFKGKSAEENHRFRYDYRRDTNFLPQNILFDTPWQFFINLVSQEHWGKRVEGSYVGDVIVPETKLRFLVRLTNTEKQAEAALNDIACIIKRETNKVVKGMLPEAISGEVKVYSIDLVFEQHALRRNIGYVMMHATTSGVVTKMILNHESLKLNTINAVVAYHVLAEEIQSTMMNNTVPIKISSMFNMQKLTEKVEAEEARRKELEGSLHKEKDNAEVKI